MSVRRRYETDRGPAVVVFTDRSDGDLGGAGDPASALDRVRAVADLPVTWVRQVHGAEVVVVDEPGGGCGLDADALVTSQAGVLLTVRGADCPLVALVSPQGVVAVAHAGWRGLVAGVLPSTVAAMREAGADAIGAVLGPCITAARYEFGEAELDAVAERLGPGVRARTAWGTPALDLVAAVRSELAGCGVDVDLGAHRCTAGDPALFSHRARAEAGRHAALIWLEAS